MGGMGKGQVWINGENVGRYWPAYKANGTCRNCSYAGYFSEKKCLSYCGDAWYHVPRSWLKPTGNLMIVFEEWGGDPDLISLMKREMSSICADIHEWQPSLRKWHLQSSGKINRPLRPRAHLWCDPGKKISSIKIASFGTPEGSCGNYRQGSCHAHSSYDILKKNCIGQPGCSATVDLALFGGDPCPDVLKKLAVEAMCS